MSFLCCDRAMFDALRHNEHFSRASPDNPIAKLNFDLTRQDEKEIVRVIVFMPNKLPLHFDHHQVMPVELTHYAGLPVF